MTEAAHTAVGEKRQVGGGALALDCSGFNCLSSSGQLLGACGGPSKLFTGGLSVALHPGWRPDMKSSS